MSMLSSPAPAPAAAALLTLWLDADGRWHASVVMPDGERFEFLSPFELARWSRGVTARRAPSKTGLR
ncbi:MAG: hypothetical protein IV093_21175 [Rubrivivax sp.]|nr:hypothetical protein [Rubrivivax sp.]